MSDGSGFDIALLEGKDRAELAAIAAQLGEKPPARAKKADIVSLILRLVGADAPSEEPVADATDAADAPDEDAPADDEAQGEAQQPASDGSSDLAASEERSPAAPSGRDRNAGRPDRSRPDAGGDDQGNERQPAGESGGEGQRDDGSEEGAESGNRRRRRRGRDRDRQRDDDQVQADPVEVEGMVDLRDEGYGFLRLEGYRTSRDDAYISLRQTRQFGLRTGDILKGRSRPAGRNEKNPALLQVDEVNGFPAHTQPGRARFDELTPVFPDERLSLELKDDPANATARIIDLLAPIGKGTRGLIASPPAAGKTTVLKAIIRSIEVNHPDVELVVVVLDERPEEVTDLQRWLLRGAIAATTFDRPAEEHAAVAELAIERAKRLVEGGKDVVVVFDGLTRLARSIHRASSGGGHGVDAGLEASALAAPRRLFSAARNAEEGGSLTILATVATQTGSRIDDVIYEDLRGVATTELALDRRLAQRRVVPAIDVDASASRHEDLLFERTEVAQVATLRRVLSGLRDETGGNVAGLELLLDRLASTTTNAALLAAVAKG